MSIQNNTLPDNPQIQVIKSGKTGLFTNYIWKAIPLAFDESMSYYETLLGLLYYLKNVVIPTVNNNANAVAELQNLYIELKSYVDDYFTNLDVQEEINNKLDAMVEDGTLQEIIASYLNSKAIFGFDTVSSMKSATNLINGSYAETLGFYNKNDGGNALYKIRTITNEDVVDEKYIIALSDNTLIAELIIDEKINIKQIGLTEESVDIGADINTITNVKNKIAYVPYGNYNVTTTINPNGYKKIIIDGNLTYNGNESCIKVNSRNNYIKTEKITTTNGICVLLENNNANSSDCVNNKLYFNDILSSTNNYAMYLHAILKGIAYNEIHFDTLSSANDKYSLYIKTESENSSVAKYINENVFYGGRCSKGLYGIYINTGTSGASGECNGLKFYNVALEGVTNGIYLNNSRANLFEVPRVAELSGHYIKIVGSCDGNFINFLSLLQPSKIDVTEMTENNAFNNFINAEISTTSGTRFARNMIACNRKLPIERLLSKVIRVNITNGNITQGETNTFTYGENDYHNYLLVNTTLNPIITLNGYFGSKGINEIYVDEQGKTKPFKLYDSYGTLIEDYSNPTTTGVKHFVCMNLNGNDTWFEI